MSERALCDLLIRMGTDAGLPINQVVEELASVRFPSFVNAAEFRSALFEVAEEQLRSEYEARVAALRQKFNLDDVQVNGVVAEPEPEDAEVAGHVLQTTPAEESTPADNPITADENDIDVFVSSESGAQPTAANDETAIWVRNDGQPMRRKTTGS